MANFDAETKVKMQDEERFVAVCKLDYVAEDLTFLAGMEVSYHYATAETVVIDEVYTMTEETFFEHFDPVTEEFEEAEAPEDMETPREDTPQDSLVEFPELPDSLQPFELFEHLLMLSQRDGVENLIEWCRQSDFYVSPASTRYHGSYDGGLIDHSLAVYDNLANLYNFSRQLYPGVPEIPIPSIILSALLHDICKVNTYHPGTRNVKNEETGQWEKVDTFTRDPMFAMGHAGKSVFIIQQFIQLTPQEAQAIYWHMGAYDTSAYNTWDEMSKAYNANLLAFLLHQADMMTTYISENPNFK